MYRSIQFTPRSSESLKKPFYSHPGRPKAGEEPQGYYYHPQITLEQSEALILPYKNQTGRFILATNHLDPEMLSPFQALSFYKEQQGTERGFRFIKDPLFFASSVFLKSTSRIMALAFIMALSLLVYSLGQRKLRRALQQAEASVPNQKGKPTARPTLRWIFQGFQSIHVVLIDGVKSLIKLTKFQRLVLRFLGSHCQKYYCLS
uniref:IS1634 family transposase n=1 Tax=Prochlorothrix hollandica TaxID=1223 RepID=UPI0011D230DE|nr:IS1634 family transposase [Prochlorothrix hollandica]